MAAFLIANYDITDAERFAEYNPGSLREIASTIKKHGGQVLASGPTEVTVGETGGKTVLISFPDADAAKAWQADDEYAPLKAIRYRATTNITESIVDGF